MNKKDKGSQNVKFKKSIKNIIDLSIIFFIAFNNRDNFTADLFSI